MSPSVTPIARTGARVEPPRVSRRLGTVLDAASAQGTPIDERWQGNDLMLTYEALLSVARELEGSAVLTVYLAREERDPGQAGLWSGRLDAALADERARVEREGDRESLGAFDAAATAIHAAVSGLGRVLPSRGWFGCATARGLLRQEPLPFAPHALVRWRDGVFLAPYVRGLKGQRAVLVALVDSRRARLFAFRDGELERLRELAVDDGALDLSDVGASKRASSVTGQRGETRTDAASAALEELAGRLQSRVASLLVDLAGDDGTVLVGGSKKAAAALTRALAPKVAGRLLDMPDVPLEIDRAALVARVEEAASSVTMRRQFELLDQARGSLGLGAVGWNDTLDALRGGAVDILLLSRELIGSSPDDAEDLVRLALAQGADVEEVGGTLGAELQSSAGGVAARLRFRAAG